MPTRKKLVKETMLPAKQAPVSFYGASAPRATLIMDKDGTKFERNQHVQLANAPLIDWASKANIKQGGGRFDNGPHPPAKPLNAFAQLVKQHKTRLLQDANLRAAYRDALPAAVVLQEAKAQARKEWKNMDADARAALDAQAEENKALYQQEYAAFVKQHPHAAAAAVKSPKARKSSRPSKPPRARGAFTIYAAEQYDALDTKPTGLTGYRTWLNGVRATWNGLEKTQQDAYVAKSTEEKAAAKEARKALSGGTTNKGKNTSATTTSTRKGPRRAATQAAAPSATKKRRTTKQPTKKQQHEEEEEVVGGSESEELEFDWVSDTDEELMDIHADSSDEEEEEEIAPRKRAKKPTTSNKKTTTSNKKPTTTNQRTAPPPTMLPPASSPQITSPTGKRRVGSRGGAGVSSTAGVSSMAKAAAAVSQTTRATGNKRKASTVSKAPATSEYSGAYELPVSPQKKRAQKQRGTSK